MKVEFEIDPATAVLVQTFISTTQGRDDNTHGPLTIPSLAQMLLEDVALMIERPGSWEGAGMCSLLSGHGYEHEFAYRGGRR